MPLPAPHLESKGPVLQKLVEAFAAASRVYAVGSGIAELPPHSQLVQEYRKVQGALDLLQCCALVSWCPEDAALVLAFKGSHCLFEQVVRDDEALGKLVPPFYLRHLETGARVVGPFEAAWERLHRGVVEAARRLIGDAVPRRVVCTGYCSGGGLAALAAPWAGLTFPSADVRCITFGAPRVGNSEFQRVFSLLVGLSYRAIYRLDPIPDLPRPRAGLSLLLQAVGSEVFFDGKQQQQLRVPMRFSYDITDHWSQSYVSGMHEAEKAAAPLPQTTLGSSHCHTSLVEVAALTDAPELDSRGDCTGQSCSRGAGVGLPAVGAGGGSGEQPATTAAVPSHGLGADGRGLEQQAAPPAVQGAGEAVPSRLLSAASTPPMGPQERPSGAERALSAPAALGPRAAEGTAEAQGQGRPGGSSGRGLGWLCSGGPAVRTLRRAFSGGSDHAQAGGSPRKGGGSSWLRRSSAAAAAAGGGAAAGVGRSDPSTALSMQDFWGELKHQSSRIEAMYKELVASGAAAGSLSPAGGPSPVMACVSRAGELPTAKHAAAGADGGQGRGMEHPCLKPLGLEAYPKVAASSSGGSQCQGGLQLQAGGTNGSQGAPAMHIWGVGEGMALEDTADTAAAAGGVQAGGISGRRGITVDAAPAGLEAPERNAECAAASPAGPQHAVAPGDAIEGSAGPGAGGERAGEGQGGQGWQGSGGEEDWLPSWWKAVGSLDEALKAASASKLHRAGELASAAYLHLPEFQKATGLKGAVLVEDPRTDAQAFVSWKSPCTAVFVFRGTANRSDALADLKFLRRQVEFLPRSFPGCKAHLGFLLQFVGITSASDPNRNLGAVLSTLSGGRQPGRVVCIGHSLGGALATLGATWAALQYPHCDVRCFTFGSPRVGNRKFVRAFQTLVGGRMRVVHRADPVPAIPPAFRYGHVEPAVFLKGPTMLLDKALWPRRLMFSIGDHSMNCYLTSLQSVLHHAEAAARAVSTSVGESKGASATAPRKLLWNLQDAGVPAVSEEAGGAEAPNGHGPVSEAARANVATAGAAAVALPLEPEMQLEPGRDGKGKAVKGEEEERQRQEEQRSLEQVEGMLGAAPFVRLFCRA